jgi:acyl-CoA synthetase (AMP-forming)/AMP-acid ligase II
MNEAKPSTVAASSLLHARRRPEKAAILSGDREVSYLTLHRESNRAAHALLRAGARRGDRIGYLGHESELFYELVLACAKAGTVFVPVNWRLTTPEVDHILRDSGAVIIFVEDEYLGKVTGAQAGLPALSAVVSLDGPAGHGTGYARWKEDAPAADLVQVPAPHTDDPVVQIYTSGTTGFPKGVVLAHRSFYTLPEATGDQGGDWIDWREDDVGLISLPGFGIAGMSWFLHTFAAGGTTVVMRMYVSEEAVRLIRDASVTTTFVAPAMLRMMLDEPLAAPVAFKSLRKVAYGAAPITPELLHESLAVFGCDFAQIYASTETGSVAFCLPPSQHVPGGRLLASAGRACPGNEAKIIDAEGKTLPPGEIGQVCVRTPAHFVEYWNQPEATARALVDGWVRMGDAGYLDEDGYLFLADRISDTIIVAGQNIYPAEVEKAIGAHPAIVDVAVVGVPDALWGEAVRAFVVRKPGSNASPRELTRFLHDRIADYKAPSSWEFIDAIPRNPGGKILRRALRERAEPETAGGAG